MNRLIENQMKHMIARSVRKTLKEMTDDDEERLPCEKSRPGDIPAGDKDIYYPGDVKPDVLAALSRGEFDECLKRVINENVRKQKIVNRICENVMRKLYESDNDTDMKRNAVMKALKDSKYNHAQLAYKLWPDMDKNTARSLFAKMANGTPDNDGVVRHFNDEDVNSLYQMIRKK
jgi:hypothetical protein